MSTVKNGEDHSDALSATSVEVAPEVASPRVVRSTASNAAIVMTASAFSAVLGFGRELITAHFFGTQSEVDAFLNASTVPLVLFGVFNGSLVGSLIPVFSDYTSTGRNDDVRRLGSTVINSLFVIMGILAVLGWLLAPVFVPIVAHGFSAEKQQLEIGMVRVLMPGIIATTLSGVCAALLNANHRFVASALVNVAANIVTICVVVSFHRTLGIYALVFGTLLGLFSQVAIQLPTIIKGRLYRFEIDLRHPGILKAWTLFLPVTAGSGALQVNLAFDRYFASTLPAGSTAALGYTTRLAFLPILVVATAIGTVVFPLVAGQFSVGDRQSMRGSIALALRMVGFIVIPCAAGLIALSHPIVQTLFERGAFRRESTDLCASLVPFACIPLVSISYSLVMARICYACKEMHLAVMAAFFVVGSNITLSVLLLHYLGASALLLANGIAMFFGNAFLLLLIWRLTEGFDWRAVAVSVARVVISAFLMGASLKWLASFSFPNTLPEPTRILNLIVLIAFGCVFYFTVSQLFGSTEWDIAFKMFSKNYSVRRPEVNATER